MDLTNILPIAVQLPLVFLFMWYNERINSQARAERAEVDKMHREERREFLDALQKIADKMENLEKSVKGK